MCSVEGIFSEKEDKDSRVWKVRGKGWHLCFEVDWNSLNKGDDLWTWSKVKNKELGTLQVPAEYLT